MAFFWDTRLDWVSWQGKSGEAVRGLGRRRETKSVNKTKVGERKRGWIVGDDADQCIA